MSTKKEPDLQKQVTIKLLPSESATEAAVKQYLSNHLSVQPSSITGFSCLKRSIDARGKHPYVLLTLNVFVNEPYAQPPIDPPPLRNVTHAPKKALIAGAGPAGLFAALKFLEKGVKPIILERGKDVRSRRRDLALLNKQGMINPESNYCFGEGGAGTYSDGKLYTRSTKRGDVSRILSTLVYFGADPNIMYEAHPHIGTNKLPQIVTAIRHQILECGGEFHFGKKLTEFVIENNSLTSVRTSDGDQYQADALILATGHSARDIFTLLHSNNILIEPKPFALGVRVEHPQSLIDNIRYHCAVRDAGLPPASYSLVQQIGGQGVFSFCMCPGGIIAPASTADGELVVNGWSPSKRDNPFANSGIVVSVERSEFAGLEKKFGPLAAMELQRSVEEKAFQLGGGRFVAPAQRLVDFTEGRISSTLPDCSYLPGIASSEVGSALPAFVYDSLRKAFAAFGEKMRGYLTNEAIVVAAESRTSSPVRIPRDPLTCEHPVLKNLYPCGEGAGYAGGIMSAAMDGVRVASAVAAVLNTRF